MVQGLVCGALPCPQDLPQEGFAPFRSVRWGHSQPWEAQGIPGHILALPWPLCAPWVTWGTQRPWHGLPHPATCFC